MKQTQHIDLVMAGATAALLGLAQPALALTDAERFQKLEQHIERLEKHISGLEQRLDKSETENRLLKGQAPPHVSHTHQHSDAKAISAPAVNLNPPETRPEESAALSQRVKALEQTAKAEKEANDNKWLKMPRNVELGTQGLRVVSADENFIMYLRGLIQADASFYLEDNPSLPSDTNGYNIANQFYMRRVRPIIEGTVWKFIDYRIMPDFAPGPTGDAINTRLYDALVDLRYFRQASLAGGQMKSPISLERLQSATALSFVERAFPTQLAPNREVGVLLHGEFDKPDYPSTFSATGRNMTVTGNFPMYMYPDFLSYQVGIFDGSVNNGSLYSDNNDSKDVQARIFSHPFIHSGWEVLEGLGVGMAGSYGDSKNSLKSANYQSPGLQKIFTYDSLATQTGSAYRLYPQTYWINGPFKLVAEYALSNQDIGGQNTSNDQTSYYETNQNMEAWNVTVDYVLTGERNAFLNQGIRPQHNLNPFENTWGAWQIAARWSPVNFGHNAFQNVGTVANPIYPFSDPRESVASATTWALGANWWLNPNVKIMFDYSQTSFDGGGTIYDESGNILPGIIDRATEKVFQTRLQMGF